MKPCHPERSLAMSEANRQTKSKDLMFAGATTGDADLSLDALGVAQPGRARVPLVPQHAR
jgi:hypothetical protein